MISVSKCIQFGISCILCSIWFSECLAQEITPRLFWPTPKGTGIWVIGYSYSTGDILFAPSLPVEDAKSRVNTGTLGYAQTLDLWGRTSNILFDLPYSQGNAQGLLLGTNRWASEPRMAMILISFWSATR